MPSCSAPPTSWNSASASAMPRSRWKRGQTSKPAGWPRRRWFNAGGERADGWHPTSPFRPIGRRDRGEPRHHGGHRQTDADRREYIYDDVGGTEVRTAPLSAQNIRPEALVLSVPALALPHD